MKLIAKSRDAEDYENKFEDDLTKIFGEEKPKIILSRKKIKEIKKDFSELRYGFSKSKINKFRGSIYNIKIFKNLSTPGIKETKKNLELRKSFSILKKYYGYDDTEYRRIKDIENLFNTVVLNENDEDYYKSMKTKKCFWR